MKSCKKFKVVSKFDWSTVVFIVSANLKKRKPIAEDLILAP
jgi:hypothetical protein